MSGCVRETGCQERPSRFERCYSGYHRGGVLGVVPQRDPRNVPSGKVVGGNPMHVTEVKTIRLDLDTYVNL